MKKLIAMIGAAAMSFGLFADAPDPSTYYSTSFEANDAGCSDGTTFDWQAADWVTTFEDAFKLVDQDGELPYASGKVRRDEFFNSKNVNNKYLKLETGTNEIKHAIGGTDRVFFDQLVKFTGFDEDPVIAADGAKIAVWLKATEENEAETNLYVTAGTGTTATNLQIDCEVAVDTWYRLTIKSLGNVIDTSAGMVQAGFLIYINGELATIVDGQREYHVNPTKIQKPADKKFYENGQLFTAIDTTSATLTSVGYQGLGGVDDIIFSKDAPDFAAAAVDVTVTPIEGAIITVKDADGNPIGQVGNVYPIPQGDFTVTYAQAPGWKFTTVTKDYNTGNLPSGNVIDDSAEVIPEKVVAQIIRESKVVAEYAASELTVVLAQGVQDGDQIKFVEGCSALDGAYVFQKDTTIDVTAGGNWAITVPGTSAELTDLFGAMPEKQITVTFTDDPTMSTFFLAGNIYGNGRVDTLIDVAGFTQLAGNLTIGATLAAEDGFGAILESDEIGGFVGDDMSGEYTIKLVGTKAKVVTTTDIAAGAFVLDSGYVLNIETNEIDETTWYTYTQVAAAVDPVCEINGKQYGSLAEALADAKTGDTLKLLKDITLTETVEINKAITFDLDNFEIKVADGTYGYAAILITESGATIQNGKVTSMASAEVASCFINFCKASGTLKNLTVNTTNFKWGVGGDLGETGDWETEYNTYTVACENVDVTGSTSVFCAEGVNLTLDENCSATQAGTHAQDWRNCAIHAGLNAIVTIAGGEYTGAYAIYKMSSPAKIYVNGGKFTGNVYMHPLQGYEGEDVLAIAAGNFDDNTIDTKYLVNNVDAGYERAWVTGDYDGYYKPGAKAITYNITYTFTGVEEADKATIVNDNPETFTVEDEITFKAAECEGYEFKGFVPAAITQGSTGDKEIVGTFEKKQQGWPDNPQDVKGQSAGTALGITGTLAGADACVLSTWAKDFNVTFNVDVDQYENAFLLNCDPAEVEDAEKAFKFTAITPGTTPTTTTQYNGRDYNGKVQITAYEDVGFTKPVDNPTGAEAELFYKAELILVPVNK